MTTVAPAVSSAVLKLRPAPGHDRPLDLRDFCDLLVEEGQMTQDELEKLVDDRRGVNQSKQHVLVYLAEQNLPDRKRPGHMLDLDTLTQKLAHYSGQPYLRIDPLNIDAAKVTEVMSVAFSQRHKILAVEVTDRDVTIASAEPFVSSWESSIAHVMRRPIKRVVANPLELARLTTELYRLSTSIQYATGKDMGHRSTLTNLEQMLELGKGKDPEANDQHVVNIVDWLLQYAFEQRASDIHIEPRRDIGNVRFRIDGVLYTVYQIPVQVLTAVTSRLKALSRMNVAEKRRPQDGRLKTKTPEGNEVELRLSTMPSAFGEKMVMRIFDPDVLLKSFGDLGFSTDDLARWQGMIGRKHGIVLITGPTGSGKTTTLYSTLKTLATREVNVCTIEDPIEMVESSFNQMQVQENIELTFASGVKALLRQDPDIIMIGEIRNLETAEIAIQAALTGHLVFSSLHTNDAPTAITRLLELGVPGYLIKATLIGVVAQRLVRILCPKCKRETEVDASIWQNLTAPWQTTLPKKVYEPAGCLECRETGYKGRQGIYEIMQMSDGLRTLVDSKADLAKLRQLAYREGMCSLRLSGAQKVASGQTSVLEVLRVAPQSH
ncbi:MAG TPA: GspE/PulE family protein [Candidatus Acidoferrum sp.]|nr:GspE/PulE family protein [Candidatus Acidoferrum sp.]